MLSKWVVLSCFRKVEPGVKRDMQTSVGLKDVFIFGGQFAQATNPREPDMRFPRFGSRDKTVRLWNTKTGAL